MRFEHWLYTLPLRLRSLFRRKQVEADLEDELQFHIEQRLAREVAAGKSAEEARVLALRAMEGVEQQKEKCRDTRQITFFENRLRDVRYALRTLKLSPGFTAAAIITLALGIGANTAIFSLVDTVMLRLLPVKAPGQLYLIGQKSRDHIAASWSYPDYCAMRDHNTTFNGVIGYDAFPEPMGVQSGDGSQELAHGIFVSGNYFDILGVPALLGRLFNSADDGAPGAAPYVVLSYAFWQLHFDGDPSVIGRKLRINAYPFTVIGVGGRDFSGADVAYRPDLFIPVMMRSQVMHEPFERWNTRHTHWLAVLGRLKPGAEIPAAEGQLLAIGKSQDEAERRTLSNPRWANTTEPIVLVPAARGHSYFADELKKPLLISFSIVVLVLAIACANLAGLMLAREAARRRETAVRLAIGASRGRVLAQLFTESMLLTVAGGTLGVLLSLAAAPTLLRFIPQPGFAPVTGIHTNLDWRVFGFTAAVCMTTGLLFGIGPAWLSTRVDLTGSLKSEAEHPSGWGRMTTRKILVVLQVAVSIPLLLAAGLFVRTLSNLRAIDIGMAGQNVYLASVNPTLFGYKGQRLREFCDSLCTRVATLPGVRSASLADITPLSGSSWNSSVTVQGYTPRAHEGTVFFDAVGPRYFETIGTPILLGRDFTERDNPPQAIELPEHLSPGDKIPDGGGKRVAIVNEAFARHYFEDRSALGGQVTIGNSRPEKDFYEVVGVVKDARYFNVRNVAPPMVFVPVWRRFASERHLVIRSSNSPMQIETALRRELHKLDPAIPLLSVRTLAHDVDENILVERMVATLCAFFGALALALCAIGLYGVVAYTVTRRTREIGIRIAVGSPAQSVLWLVMREVIAMIFVGTALGGLAALLASHAIASVLFGVHTSDPVSLLAAGSCLTVAAVLASFFPARRAMRIDPMQALRYE